MINKPNDLILNYVEELQKDLRILKKKNINEISKKDLDSFCKKVLQVKLKYNF